jgi:hypothetical protein
MDAIPFLLLDCSHWLDSYSTSSVHLPHHTRKTQHFIVLHNWQQVDALIVNSPSKVNKYEEKDWCLVGQIFINTGSWWDAAVKIPVRIASYLNTSS